MVSSSVSKEGLHIKRPCLLVADLERALKVYRDILGFHLDYQSEASPNSYLYTVFGLPKEAKLTFAALNSECETRALAFAEVKGIDLPPPTIPRRTGIVIRVRDLDRVISQIRALGLLTVEPHSFDAPPNLRFSERGFCDYDGHLIVLYEVREIPALMAKGN
jgi:catechol 2,3-dioxygenase-like lactoylglutathione lyase family enzyme